MKQKKPKAKAKRKWIEWRVIWGDGSPSLMTFKSQEDARNFTEGTWDSRVIKVEVKEL
jgi:hypothetical protein